MTVRPAQLDPGVQDAILRHLADHYPNPDDDLTTAFPQIAPGVVLTNAVYLWQHGLIEGLESDLIGVVDEAFSDATITARGLDYLQEDGGLGARLGVVTIRLHQDEVRDLLIAHLERSTAPSSVKRELIKALHALPGQAMASITMGSLAAGLKHLPDIAATLRTLLRSK